MHAKHNCTARSPMAVTIDHHHGFKQLVRTQRCKLQSFTHLEYAGLEPDRTNLACSLKATNASARFHRSFSTPCLSAYPKGEDNTASSPRVEIIVGHRGPQIRELVVEAAIALASGVEPELARNGLGGAYYLRSRAGESIAIVKPINEEPSAMNNREGIANWILSQPNLKHPVRIGENGLREVAAYLLDHDGFAGVPPTALIKVSHLEFHVNHNHRPLTPVAPQMPIKIMSIQRFVSHDFDAGDLGPSRFSVASVHCIGILDIRLLNIDRHAGNILVKNCGHGSFGSCGGGAAELVPIDHGLCLPESLEGPYFEWLHWPQAFMPFSEPETNYISGLDPWKDAELLRSELPLLRESSMRILILCTNFLKRAACAGLCLADIGNMMTREFHGTEEKSSVLETICREALKSMNRIFSDDSNSPGKETEEERMEQFQIDMDGGDTCTNNHVDTDAVDLPSLLQCHPKASKPSKVPLRYPYTRWMDGNALDALSPLDEEDHNYNDGGIGTDAYVHDVGNKYGSGADIKMGCLMKSVSLQVKGHEYDCRDISFGDMNEDEWELFLDRFEELLPKAFELWKRMGLKQRLGTSCKLRGLGTKLTSAF